MPKNSRRSAPHGVPDRTGASQQTDVPSASGPSFASMRQSVALRAPGLLTYGITPPKKSFDEAKRRETAKRQVARIKALPIDGLVLYDIQDESMRTAEARPFPFLECISPVDYAYDYLGELTCPKVVYQCVGTSHAAQLKERLRRINAQGDLSVLVGAASRGQQTSVKLPEAYALRANEFPELPVGGVLIAERHTTFGLEDERLLRKMDAGCSFFVTQAVYSTDASKNVLSDLHYRCQRESKFVPPILITLSPCGSRKTLEFLAWLGVSVPRWLENELVHSPDILETSVDICEHVFEDLLEFAQKRAIPLGCNVESVSLRKAEIDASVELTERIAKLLDRSDSRLGASPGSDC